MFIQQLWRYPVKSMKGEPLEEAALVPDGISGDRLIHVRGRGGRIITSRTHPRLLALRAALGDDGVARVDGLRWNDPTTAKAVHDAAGAGAMLVAYDGLERFDVLPLLVATDGAIEAFGEDGRRLRPNIVIGDVAGLAEREWAGRTLRIGGEDGPLIAVDSLRRRCVMTTYHPDTQVQDHHVLRKILRDFGGELALDCAVKRPGRVCVGDPVTLS